MNKIYSILSLSAFLVFGASCSNSAKNATPSKEVVAPVEVGTLAKKPVNAVESHQKLTEFVPKNFTVLEVIQGDLNKDGVEDCVVFIQATKKEDIVDDEYKGQLDRNRRGIIVLLKEKDSYVLAAKNYDCFSSGNEDGGAYFSPELEITIENGKLYIHYGHGRYGDWTYTFRLKNSDLELIGYDSTSGAPVIESETSINFLTKKKQVKTNTNESAEGEDEIFDVKTETISSGKPIQLSEIEDFDVLDVE